MFSSVTWWTQEVTPNSFCSVHVKIQSHVHSWLTHNGAAAYAQPNGNLGARACLRFEIHLLFSLDFHINLALPKRQQSSESQLVLIHRVSLYSLLTPCSIAFNWPFLIRLEMFFSASGSVRIPWALTCLNTQLGKPPTTDWRDISSSPDTCLH